MPVSSQEVGSPEVSLIDDPRCREINSPGKFSIVVNRSHGWFTRVFIAAATALGFGFGAWFAVHALDAGDATGIAVGELGALGFILISLFFALFAVPQSWLGRTQIVIRSSEVRISYSPRQASRFPNKFLVDRKLPTQHVGGFELRQVPLPAGLGAGVWARRLHVVTHRDCIRIEVGELRIPVLENLVTRLNRALEESKKAAPYR